MTRQNMTKWLLFLVWAVFINACNVWIIRPLVADFALLGVVAIVVLTALWITSLPAAYRRGWIGFTIFSLLAGDGLGELATRPWLLKIGLSIVVVVGMTVLGAVFTKWKFRYFFGTGVLLTLLNWWLPLNQWAYLTHFSIAYRAEVPIRTGDIPALPLQAIPTDQGTALVTLENLQETDKQLQDTAQAATDSPDALENLLRNAGHRYSFVELVQSGGHFKMQDLPASHLAEVNPLDFSMSFFPFVQAQWTVENGHVVQYMSPAQSPNVLMQLLNGSGYLPSLLTTVGENTEQQELTNWNHALRQLQIVPANNQLQVSNNTLTGQFDGHAVSIPVKAYAVIGEGAFTAPGAHEVLLQGVNKLEVVSLDTNKVISDYSGSPRHPLPSDIVTGPIDNSGRDVIFVNSSPAMILQANASGTWTTLYTAPNQSLRFEAAVKFSGDQVPEIITDDPSYIRNSPVRYFSSYTYRNGDLVRNWRVFHTNVVNVHPVQFTAGGPQYLVTCDYGGQDLYVLKRHYWPVVPMSSGLLGISIVCGWLIRMVKGRRRQNA